MAVTDTALGFKFEYRLSGQPATTHNFLFKDTETLHKGDLLNVESGEVDLAATNDGGLLGIANETKAGTDSTTLIEAITDADAVYSVYDPNVRKMGDILDLAGATGAMTLATDSNHDLRVVANSGADERTLVMINEGKHVLN